MVTGKLTNNIISTLKIEHRWATSITTEDWQRKLIDVAKQVAQGKIRIIEFLKEGLYIRSRYNKIIFFRIFIDYIINYIDLKKAINEVSEIKVPQITILFFELLKQQEFLEVSIDELINSILETNDAQYIYELALVAPKEIINKLAAAIIETKNACYMYRFAKNISDAPRAKLIVGIFNINDETYIRLVKTNIVDEMKNKAKLFGEIIEELKKQNIPIDDFISAFFGESLLYSSFFKTLSEFSLFTMINLKKKFKVKNKNLMLNPTALPLLGTGETSLLVVSNNQSIKIREANTFDECFYQQITGICSYIVRESDKLIPSMKEIITKQLKNIFECFTSEIPVLGEEAVTILYNRLEGLKLAIDYQLPPIDEMQNESKYL